MLKRTILTLGIFALFLTTLAASIQAQSNGNPPAQTDVEGVVMEATENGTSQNSDGVCDVMKTASACAPVSQACAQVYQACAPVCQACAPVCQPCAPTCAVHCGYAPSYTRCCYSSCYGGCGWKHRSGWRRAYRYRAYNPSCCSAYYPGGYSWGYSSGYSTGYSNYGSPYYGGYGWRGGCCR